jgi:hypothetical protein
MLPFLLWVVVANGLVTVPQEEWKPIDIIVSQADSTLECTYRVQEGGGAIQVLFMDRTEGGRFQQGRRFTPVAMSPHGRGGQFRTRVDKPGEYVLILDNRLETTRTARVDLKVDVSVPTNVLVRTLAPERKRAVIAISLLVFGATVAGSAAIFLRQTRG